MQENEGEEPMKSPAQPVDLARSYLLLNHHPVVMITSAANGRTNVMSASWVMPLDFDPPKVALVVDGRSFTRELIEASGELALNIPCRDLAAKVLAAGSVCGRDCDKFAQAGLDTFAASRIAAPLISGCVAWLECRVIPEPHNQKRYDLFVAEVVAAAADPVFFSEGRWHFPAGRGKTFHYRSDGAFFETGEAFQCPDAW